jgi:hypothetical protein
VVVTSLKLGRLLGIKKSSPGRKKGEKGFSAILTTCTNHPVPSGTRNYDRNNKTACDTEKARKQVRRMMLEPTRINL